MSDEAKRIADLERENAVLRDALKPFYERWEKMPKWMRNAAKENGKLAADGVMLTASRADHFEAAHTAYSALAHVAIESPVVETTPVPEPVITDMHDPDECCGRHLAKALREGLAGDKPFECPKCGCQWIGKLDPERSVRYWSPVVDIQIIARGGA